MLITAVTFFLIALAAVGVEVATDITNVRDIASWSVVMFLGLAAVTAIAHILLSGGASDAGTALDR